MPTNVFGEINLNKKPLLFIKVIVSLHLLNPKNKIKHKNLKLFS